MWFLECDGELFEHKRKWLRPGTKHILGRTSKPEDGLRVRYIENGSVSRQHLKIEIENIKPGDSTHLHSKSKLTVTDNSKLGTLLNGEKLHKTSKVLDRSDNDIRLGNYESPFTIKWKPYVFSFPSVSRSSRQQDDPLAQQRQILEPLDIKCVTDYVTQYTSHVVSKKRNTQYVLQALVNARYIVTESYLQQLASLDISALEEDFDAFWPSALDFSPPPGNEPNPRPDKSPDFLPNPQRSDMFSNYTFIFSDSGQHANLMSVVTGGGGKALCRPLNPSDPDLQGLINYVREVAGKKGDSLVNLNQQHRTKGGIIVISIGGGRVSMRDFYQKLESSLGQESVEQNELLEAILDADPAKLKRPVEVRQVTQEPQPEPDFEPVQDSPPPRRSRRQTSPVPSQPAVSVEPEVPAPSATPDESTPDPSQRAPSTTRRRGRRPLTQTKFKGFEEIDMSQLPKYRSPSPSQPPGPETNEQPSADVMDDIEFESQSQPAATQQSQRSSRKRPAEEDVESHQDIMNGILKGAAVMKRRRLAEERMNNQTLNTVEEEERPATESVIKKPKRRKDKEIDVMALVNERRQAEEEARLQDEERLRDALEGMEVSEIRNLAQVEEMEVVRKEPPPRATYDPVAGHDGRWNDRWNGRKNFKKFRRQGNAGHTQSRPRVFVQLEEVVGKDFNVDDQFFLERTEESRRKKQKNVRSQQQNGASQRSRQSISATPDPTATTNGTLSSRLPTQSQTQRRTQNNVNLVSDSDSDEDSSSRFRRRLRDSRAQDAETSRLEQLFPEEIAGVARDSELASAARQAKTTSQNRTQAGKRTAEPVEMPKPKRQTRIREPSPDEDESEDDEESAMRFRRRKR